MPQIERLERRRLLSVAPAPPCDSLSSFLSTTLAEPPVEYSPPPGAAADAGSASPYGLTPAQIRRAYGIDQVTFDNGTVQGSGLGQTIAIVDAFDDPTIFADLDTFDQAFSIDAGQDTLYQQYGNSASFLTKLNQDGNAGPLPAPGWEGEISLDVEWAHAIAPAAKIVLVEANTNGDDLYTATETTRQLPNVSVVSMSWSGGEGVGETGTDGTFTAPAGHTPITFLASSGDDGTPAGYPANSPNVVAVGGTDLTVDASGYYGSEDGWSGSGGGISTVEAQPSYQNSVVSQSTIMRTTPDVSFDGGTAVAICDSYENGAATPWGAEYGTSFSAPAWAALIALANQDRALYGLPTLDGLTQTLPRLYALPDSDFHDITTGNNGFAAGPGYDLVTGRGTPIANTLVADLADAPADLIVSNTADSGPGSLRQAITDANANPGRDTISFDIPGNGPFVIEPQSALPYITDSVVLDATTQPGYNGVPLVVLDGDQAGSNDGILLKAGDSIVRGFVVQNFALVGINIDANDGGNVITGNYIGTDATGTQAAPNGTDGIYIGASANNIIGGGSSSDRNVISGNSLNGIEMAGSGTPDNLVMGNYVGVDVTGSKPLGNGADGVYIRDGAHDNRIGVDGADADAAGEANIISGNGHDGVGLEGSGTKNNTVAGNLIGTDSTGTIALGGNHYGVRIGSGASNNMVGSAGANSNAEAERNVIAGNLWDGVYITDSGTQGNNVVLNWIGTPVGGALALPNGGDGVHVVNGASSSSIYTNVIEFNQEAGVAIDSGAGNNVGVNTIYANGGLGIDLGSDGVTPNHAGGPLSGPNDWQNYPVLNSASYDGSEWVVQGSLAGAPNTAYSITLYHSPLADPTGFGEGFLLAEFFQITTDASGNASFSEAISGSISSNDVISATATAPNGDTSEFSRVATLINHAPSFTATDPPDVPENAGTQTLANWATFNPGLGGNESGQTATYTVSNLSNGALFAVPPAVSPNGTLTYTPAAGQSGLCAFDVTVQDSGGTAIGGVDTSATQRFIISVGGSTAIMVHNTNDTGLGSLRRAITDANAYPGRDTISFDIIGFGAHTIEPLSALPEITDPVVLDATTQPAYGGVAAPIVLDGDKAGAASGLTLFASNSVVRGFVIQRFALDGVLIGYSNGNVVAGNYIGTDVAGTQAAANGSQGVEIIDGADNTIGGAAMADRNVISGNLGEGIKVEGGSSTGNLIIGNYIGTDASGIAAVGNVASGVFILNGATNNRVGADGADANPAAEGNLISGNGVDGVVIQGAGTDGNWVSGNLIGTDKTGMVALGGNRFGVRIDSGASNNTVGTNADGAGDRNETNVISGNRWDGVIIVAAGTDGNVVAGNLIGTDATGKAALGDNFGVKIDSGASNNRIGTNGDGVADAAEANIISGNRLDGVLITGAGTDGNVVAGNLIGTDAAGEAALGDNYGVRIDSGAADNRIGTNGDGVADAAETNVISGNRLGGVLLTDAGTTGNIVAGNRIGTDAAGTAAVGNDASGVYIQNGATGNRVGADGADVDPAAEANLISGNSYDGVAIEGAGTSGNWVAGNLIGTNKTGTVALGGNHYGVRIDSGASDNIIGTDADEDGDAFERNVISGNQSSGVYLTDAGTTGNIVAGNSIGTDTTGTAPLPNHGDGVTVNIASGNTIGGDAVTDRNIISGNAQSGIDSSAATNVIAGNYIGTDGNGRGLGQGAVAWYKGEGNADDSVYQSQGTLEGNAGYTAGEVGHGFSFGGGLDEVQVANSATGLLDITGPAITVEAWVYQTSADQTDNAWGTQAIAAKWYDTANKGYLLETINGQLGFAVVTANGRVDDIAAPALPLNTWVHVAGTYDGQTIRVFENGTLLASVTQTGSILHSGSNFSIGNLGSNYGWKGDIDELTVYDRALEPRELAAIVSDGSAGKPNFMGNRADGIRLENSAGNSIGGSAATDPNVISGNLSCGIDIDGDSSSGNLIMGNYIGTDASGTAAVGNGVAGVLIRNGATFNRVGADGADADADAEGNLISGNRIYGVQIVGTGADNNVVAGNFIGTDKSGELALGNDYAGIMISSGAMNNRIGTDGDGNGDAAERNVISGNADEGVFIEAINGNDPSGNIVAGNYIGADASGAVAVKNGYDGVLVGSGATNNRVGVNGADPDPQSEANLISGNGQNGVTIVGAGTNSNWTAGNLIGTDKTGAVALPNSLFGVMITAGAANNLIGSNLDGVGDAAEANVISGNKWQGVEVYGTGTTGNAVSNNLIGLAENGVDALGNGGDGVLITSDASGNVIGDSTGRSGNQIAFNSGPGISVFSGTNNRLNGNRIHDNGGLGIDLGGDGVTANDAGDADSGANQLQNFPVVTAVSYDGTTLTIQGTLNSAPSATYTIELFAGGADPSDYGEGDIFLGRVNATTDASGNAIFSESVNIIGLSYQAIVSATATDSSGNTSEFSQIATLINHAPSFAAANPPAVDENSGAQTVANWATFDSGPGSNEASQTATYTVSNVSNGALFSAAPAVAPDGTLTYTLAPNQSGTSTFDVQVQDSGDTAHGGVNTSLVETFTITVNRVVGGLSATNVQPTDTGFTVMFNEPIDPSVLHLYDTAATDNRSPDVTLKGSAVGYVGGSLVIGAGNESMTFIATAGVLQADSYTLTLRSAADGFEMPDGTLLTGSDGKAGDDYTQSFTVAAPAAGTVIVSLPNFARGPGQNVNLPANVSTGIPLSVSQAQGITSLALDIDYNPSLLEITGATSSVAGATVNVNTSVVGVAHVTYSVPTALTAMTNLDIIDLQANVPSSAAGDYRSTEILAIRKVSINGGAIGALEGDALQVVAYQGDARGQLGAADQGYKGGDALLIARVAAGLDAGFASFPLVAPIIAGGVRLTSELSVSGADALQLARAAAGLSSTLPPLPYPLPTTTLAAASAGFAPAAEISIAAVAPTLALSVSNASATPDSDVTVPVDLSDGGANLSGLDAVGNIQLVVRYDPSVLTASANPVSLGSLTQGWSLTQSTPDNTAGELFVEAQNTGGLTGAFSGDVFDIKFHVAAGATGSTKVSIASAYTDSGSPPHVYDTEVDDETSNPITLNPAPTNDAADPVFGTVTVSQAAAITSANSTTFTAGTAGTFTIATTGVPTPTISTSDTLPSGVTLTDKGDGTATLASTAAAAAGVYHFTIDAHIGVATDATQNFTLTVSAATTTLALSIPNEPATPAGDVTVPIDLSDGGANLSGLDAVGNIQLVVRYDPSVLTASANAVSLGSLTQGWSLTPGTPDNTDGELFVEAQNTGGLTGAFSGDVFDIKFHVAAGATGSTKVSIASTYTDSGSPPHVYDTEVDDETSNRITLNPAPTNGSGDPVFGAVTVSQAPAIASANSMTFTAGIAGTFTITTTGVPLTAITETGALPSGVTLTDNGNGTATLASTSATPAGVYQFTLDAGNGVGPDATQIFTLTVSAASQTAVTLSIASSTAVAGSDVMVPIDLSDGSDNLSGTGAVGGIEVVVRFDPSVLTAVSASLGSLTTGWSLTEGTPDTTDGELFLEAFNTTGLTGDFSGDVFKIDFKVAAGASGSTAVSIASAFTNTSVSPPHLYDTEIDDENSNPIALSPAPTNDASDPVFGTVAIGFSVTSVQPTDTGFTVTFNQPFNASGLHLYDTQANGNRPADVTLVGASVGAIAGSLVVDRGNQSATFIATAGVLPPDSYTVTLRTGPDGFETPAAVLLTGSDGTVGDNYTYSFTAAGPPTGTVTVSLPNFACGPEQEVSVPASISTGIPLTVSQASGITSLAFDIDYNPALLSITAATTSISRGTVALTFPASGVAHLVFTSTTALAAAANEDLVDLHANVPATAASEYGAEQVLAVRSVSINGGAIAALDGDALEVVAYQGDVRGQLGAADLAYKVGDALLIARVGAGLDGGFAAFPLVAPLVVGGVRTVAESNIGVGDALVLARAAAGLSNSLPDLPYPLPKAAAAPETASPDFAHAAGPFALTADGASPTTITLSIPNVTATAGGNVTVPIDLSDGSENLSGTDAVGGIEIIVRFDPSVLTEVSASLGSLTTGWSLTEGTPDNTNGELFLEAFNTTGMAGNFSGDVFTLHFKVAAGATGSTAVSIAPTFTDNSVSPPHLYDTEVDDENSDPIALNPAPTNDAGDPVLGTVTVSQAPSISSADSATFIAGTPGTFSIITAGVPTAAITETGMLPSGVTLSDNKDGTATISSTAAAAIGVYQFTIDAGNGVGTDALQTFTLTIGQAPQFTSADTATFTAGTAGAFTAIAAGFPIAAITETGTLPSGVSLQGNGDGTATLTSTATAAAGIYHFTLVPRPD